MTEQQDALITELRRELDAARQEIAALELGVSIPEPNEVEVP